MRRVNRLVDPIAEPCRGGGNWSWVELFVLGVKGNFFFFFELGCCACRFCLCMYL